MVEQLGFLGFTRRWTIAREAPRHFQKTAMVLLSRVLNPQMLRVPVQDSTLVLISIFLIKNRTPGREKVPTFIKTQTL